MSAILPIFLALSGPLQGDTPIEAPGMAGLDMTRYAMVCLGLVVGILLLGWGFKRVLSGNLRMRAGQRSMKVVDVLPLGAKRQLAVVRCYDRTFVLGLGEREVNLVTELDVDEDVEQSLSERGGEPARRSPRQGRFGNMLESAMSRWTGGQSEPAKNPETRPSNFGGDRLELTPTAPPEAKPPAAQEHGGESSLGRGLMG